MPLLAIEERGREPSERGTTVPSLKSVQKQKDLTSDSTPPPFLGDLEGDGLSTSSDWYTYVTSILAYNDRESVPFKGGEGTYSNWTDCVARNGHFHHHRRSIRLAFHHPR